MTGAISSFIVAFLILGTSAFAFVEKLNPNHPANGGIPCHGIHTSLFYYIIPGGPAPAILNSIIQREWVPDGWSAQDITDNTNMLALIDGQATLWQKMLVVELVRMACINWEMDVDEFSSPSKFRQRVGLPAAP